MAFEEVLPLQRLSAGTSNTSAGSRAREKRADTNKQSLSPSFNSSISNNGAKQGLFLILLKGEVFKNKSQTINTLVRFQSHQIELQDEGEEGETTATCHQGGQVEIAQRTRSAEKDEEEGIYRGGAGSAEIEHGHAGWGAEAEEGEEEGEGFC